MGRGSNYNDDFLTQLSFKYYGSIPEDEEEGLDETCNSSPDTHDDDGNSSTTSDLSSNGEYNWTKLDVYSKICGLLYIVILFCGVTTNVGILGQLVDYTSITNTANNITTYPILFRTGLLIEVVMNCCNIFVAVLLGAILIEAGANPVAAICSSAFRFLRTIIIAINLLHMFVASLLLDKNFTFADMIETAFDEEDSNKVSTPSSVGYDIVYLFLLVHKYGYLMALIFFGISLIILGDIALKWHIFPHSLGLMICISGLCYLVDSALYFTQADYFGDYTPFLRIPARLFELMLALWLLCYGPTKAKSD